MSQNTEINSEAEGSSLEELTSDGQGSGLEVEKLEEGAIKAPFDPAKIDVINQARTRVKLESCV
jgi:hypothetical protein